VRTSQRSRLALITVCLGSGFGLAISLLAGSAPAQAQPRARPAPVTRADVDRLDKKIEDTQRRLEKLIKLQLQYMQALVAMSDGASPPPMPEPKADPKAADSPKPPEPKVAEGAKPADAAKPKPAAMVVAPPKKPKETVGNIVGKVTGAADAIVYVDDIVVPAKGTATMKQENKTFTPAVLVVQKGMTVQFPNLDAFFHNVFSVTPDNSFDLGSYRQGETKSVTMTKPGVVSVYCNMHPQMVGHILVVPNANYVRAGKDGFFRISNVPAGHHRIVAWAPDSKPAIAETEVTDTEAATVEIELKRGRGGPHLKKDGMPYGSYDK
jgi:plastocyanin